MSNLSLPTAPLDDLDSLCQFLFKIKPHAYEKRILETILKKKCKRTTIRSPTRAGKTFTIAKLIILAATFFDNFQIGVIAPTHDKSRKVGEYVAELMNVTPYFNDIVMISTEGLTNLERLKKEVSKKKITLKNNSSIEFKSVDLNREGFAVMGLGYDLIIVEESAEIPDEAYAKIYRMLLEHPDSMILEIGNPWNLGHFYEHHHSNEWEKIHITYQECIEAGRFTREAVEDMRRNMTTLQFKVLVEAEFPDSLDFAVFNESIIKQMTRKRDLDKIDEYLVGVDVARGGTDYTVITTIAKKDKDYYFLESKQYDTNDIMIVVGLTRQIADQLKRPYKIAVDCVGLGVGVHDRLKELKYPVFEFKAGNSAKDSSQHANIKTETVYDCFNLAKDGHIFNIPENSRLVLELRSWVYEVKSDKQIKVVDPDGKSPDHADSFIIALSLISKAPLPKALFVEGSSERNNYQSQFRDASIRMRQNRYRNY